MESEIFRQLERITQLGLLTFALILLLIGLGVYQQLSPVEEVPLAFCGVPDEGGNLGWAEEEGRALFLEYCASCHNNNMVDDMTGPALLGATARWKEYDGAIYQWIRNSEGLAKAGNPRAQAMLEWSSSTMPAFENLDTIAIAQILAYIDAKSGE